MKYLTSTILIGIIFVTTFGFASMRHDPMSSDMTNMNEGCIASFLDRVLCPEGGLGLAAHHVSAYLSFLNTQISGFFTFGLALLALSLVALTALCRATVKDFFRTILHDFFRRLKSLNLFSLFRLKISDWLSLFENSPAAA